MKLLALAALLFLSISAPAQPYFQQHVDTRLSVRLDDQKQMLHGFEQLRYSNHSPDTLFFLYLHLWPNAYSSDRTYFCAQQVLQGNTAFYFSTPEEKGFIDSLSFRVNGEAAPYFSDPGYPDIARLELPQPLAPGASLELETPFRVKIPKVFSRLGHTGQAYYISQWFPKPAVYDRNGWHPLPYSDQGEFYSEFGSYDVRITLPKNYVVLATGECLDRTETDWWNQLSLQPVTTPERPYKHVREWRRKVNQFPPSSSEWKTLHFVADSVHDFAWFADKRYILRRDSVHIPGGHEVNIYTACLPSEWSYWKNATGTLKQTLLDYSAQVGAYPYRSIKAVEGDLKAGGGMEYPTITIIDRLATQLSVTQTLVHEAGHNWFYAVLANNERTHPWMDEGCNSFAERSVEQKLLKKHSDRNTISIKIEDELYYQLAATHLDQSLQLSSSEYRKLNYGADVYFKTALFLRWLEHSMGPDTFQQAMHRYFDDWKFRHPQPADFRQAFERVSKRNLDWFFDGAMRTNRGIDFSLKKVWQDPESTHIHLRNRSGFAAPAGISTYAGDSLLTTIWTSPFRHDTLIQIPNTSATRWQIAHEVPDYDALNNRWQKGALLHGRMLRLRIGLGIGRKNAPVVYALPALGYNTYDGFMAGLLLHNLCLPEHRLRYILTGMWGTNSNAFTGAGSVGYWLYPQSLFQEIVPQVDLKSFHFNDATQADGSPLFARYLKLAPSLSFLFKNASPLSPALRRLTLKVYGIWEQGFSYSRNPADTTSYIPSLGKATENNYGLLRYEHRNERTFNPFSYTLEGQMGDQFTKLSATGKLRIDYNMPNKSLYLRGFAGKYFSHIGDDYSDYRYWLSSTFSGANDYLYEGSFLGRNERDGLLSQQYSMQEGGQKIATPLYGFPLGRSNDWLLALNLRSDLPLGKLPIRAYLDLSTYADATQTNPSGNRFLYSAGLELHLLQDVFLLHLPLLLCPDYRDYLNSMYPNSKLGHSISFSLELQNINWLRTIPKLLDWGTR
ncbi:MAG: M1 family metallopeptidase [Bacteroidetes bacterium]|nr:M1 family metallopeptidase [Bacteroidota bacterium]MBS1630330.1 M1 family metallopeptidase [Bacteroidota bacterium]